MKLIIPKQHGAWGMLLIPFVLGILTGKWTWYHIPLFFSVVFCVFSYISLINVCKTAAKEVLFILFFSLLW